MIKFRKILEKAASSAGGARSPLLIGISGEGQPRRAEPPADGAVMEGLLSSTATLEPPGPEPHESQSAPAATVGEAVQPEAPAAREALDAEVAAVSAPAEVGEPGADAAGDTVVTDSLIASVLEDIQTEGAEAAAAREPREEAPIADALPDDAQAAAQPQTATTEAAPAPEPGADGGHAGAPAEAAQKGPSSEAVIEGMINDAFTSIEEAEARKRSDLDKAQEAFVDAGPQSGSQGPAIDDSFISEVDKLLNAFGNANDFLGTQEAATSAESVLAEVADIAAQAAAAGEAGAAEAQSEISAAAQPVEEAQFDISFADTHGAQDDGPVGQILGEAFGPLSGPRAKRKSAPREGADKEAPTQPQTVSDDTFDDEAQARPATPEDMAEIVSLEEKEALFDGEARNPANDEMAQIEKELDEAGSIVTSPPASGEPAELTLDFAAATGSVDPTDDAPREKTDDLLSRMLADLDRLGPVEKPQKEAPREDAPSAKCETEDFSQILSELNSPPADAVAAQKAAAPAAEAVEVSAESRSEEEIIDEAMEAADEPIEASAESSEPTAEGQAIVETGEDAPKPEVVTARRPEGSRPARAGGPGYDIAEDALGDDDGEGPGGAAPAAPADSAGEFDEEAPGEAKPAEELEDETTLLANLEASMETAAQRAKQEAAKAAAQEQRNPPAHGRTVASAATAQAPSPEQEEERVRKQVLDRSREVEQKVLDDVFGEKRKDFRAGVKAELASADEADRQKLRDGQARDAMLSADPSGAFSGAIEQTVSAPRVFDGHFGVFWLAWQINRPFTRWLAPASLKLVGTLALILLGTSLAWLAAALYHILHGM